VKSLLTDDRQGQILAALVVEIPPVGQKRADRIDLR
jgi:hypothetical protein